MRSAKFLFILIGLFLVACGSTQHKPQPEHNSPNSLDSVPPDSNASPEITPALAGQEWRLVELSGAAVTLGQGTVPNILFTEQDSRVSGHNGCNRFFGGYKVGVAGTDGFIPLIFSALASTRMACLDPVTATLEQKFTEALHKVDFYVLRGDTLVLYGAKEPLLKFESGN
jgi:heat shock protein HslJ